MIHLLLEEKRDIIPFVPKPMGVLGQLMGNKFVKRQQNRNNSSNSNELNNSNE